MVIIMDDDYDAVTRTKHFVAISELSLYKSALQEYWCNWLVYYFILSSCVTLLNNSVMMSMVFYCLLIPIGINFKDAQRDCLHCTVLYDDIHCTVLYDKMRYIGMRITLHWQHYHKYNPTSIRENKQMVLCLQWKYWLGNEGLMRSSY